MYITLFQCGPYGHLLVFAVLSAAPTLCECHCKALALVAMQVDPKLIGGAVVEVGDRFIALSVLSRVKKVQQMILESV